VPRRSLTPVRSEATIPRWHPIFRGDSAHWNAFATERCSTMSRQVDDPADPHDYIPDSALDWSTVIFRDKYGNPFDHEVAPVNPY
jgi:hypothetical protein